MRIKSIVTGPFQANTYLVWKESEGRVIIIDPGDEAELLKEEIVRENLSLGAILVTHAHLDHIGAVDELRKWSGAAVCLPEREREALGWLPESYRFFGLPEKPIPYVDHWLTPEQTNLTDILTPAQLGGLAIAVHATPGHSIGGVCYAMDKHWFVGDTLFCGSVGRIDLPGGDWPTLQESLRYLMHLHDDIVIHPGHGPETTIGWEKRTNPFLLEIRDQDTG
ncbi:MAG: MBL fold metallo-hydrolase [Candidatus Neomarinimicrobiota bacterium]